MKYKYPVEMRILFVFRLLVFFIRPCACVLLALPALSLRRPMISRYRRRQLRAVLLPLLIVVLFLYFLPGQPSKLEERAAFTDRNVDPSIAATATATAATATANKLSKQRPSSSDADDPDFPVSSKRPYTPDPNVDLDTSVGFSQLLRPGKLKPFPAHQQKTSLSSSSPSSSSSSTHSPPTPAESQQIFSSSPNAATSTSTTSQADTIHECLRDYSNEYPSLLDCVQKVNKESPIRNQEMFSGGQVVIALLVHKRADYLVSVLESLRKTHGISHATLIVSHDGYFPEVESVIQTVNFCRVKQIYHPYSKDLRDSDATSSVRLLPGNPRTTLEYDWKTAKSPFLMDERLVQAAPKHHYLWLWNALFQEDSFLRSSGGALSAPEATTVLFLEDDHYVSNDILIQLPRVLKAQKEHCPECFSVNLGFHAKDQNRKPIKSHWQVVNFKNFDNIGLVMTDRQFSILRGQNFREFCEHNDYNWDLTLFHFARARKIPDASLTMAVSRVVHIGYVPIISGSLN